MGNKPTISAVAELAGVSRGTVDRVINNRNGVRKDVRERVLNAIHELGYFQAHTYGQTRAASICRLGVVLPDWNGYFLSEASRGITDAKHYLRDNGTEVFVQQCETDLPDETIEKMNDLVEKGVTGIALCAKNHASIRERIDHFAEQGVLVITFNSDIPESRRVSFVGEDLVRSGRVAGDILSKYVEPDVRLLATVGNLEFDAHKRRLQGFLERMKECGFAEDSITVVQTYNDYTLSYQKVSEELERAPDLAGIYMANESLAGCVDAVRAARHDKRIHIISHDLTEVTQRLLRSGDVDFTIAQDIYRQGYKSLMLLYDALVKQQKPEELEHLPLQIICSQNFD